MAQPVITARGVGKRFATREGEAAALEGLDLEVRPGEFLSLLGPSGCGKSTFLYMVAGLVPRWGRNTQADAGFLRLEAYLNELLEHDIRQAAEAPGG